MSSHPALALALAETIVEATHRANGVDDRRGSEGIAPGFLDGQTPGARG